MSSLVASLALLLPLPPPGADSAEEVIPLADLVGAADRDRMADYDRKFADAVDADALVTLLKEAAEKFEAPLLKGRMHAQVAAAEAERGDHAAAADALKAALKFSPPGAEREYLNGRLVTALLKDGRRDEALGVVRDLPDRRRGDVKDISDLIGHANRSKLYLTLGLPDSARASYVSRSPPDDAPVELVRDYIDFGNVVAVGIAGGESDPELITAAANLQLQLLRKYPEQALSRHYSTAAQTLKRAGEVGKAWELRAAAARFPDSPEAAYVLSERAAAASRDEAIELYTELLDHPAAGPETRARAARAIADRQPGEPRPVRPLVPIPDPIGQLGDEEQ